MCHASSMSMFQHEVNLHDKFIFKLEKSVTDYTKITLTARKQVTIVLLKEILQIHCRLASFWCLQVEDGLQPINKGRCNFHAGRRKPLQKDCKGPRNKELAR